MTYVTKDLIRRARLARVLSPEEYKYIKGRKRKDRNNPRFRELCARVRAWIDGAPAAPASPAVPAAPSTGGDTADRVARFVARRNEIGPIPPPRHRRLRESCRFNLERFGWIYCRAMLDHRASPIIRERLVLKMQQAILNGGQLAVQFTRGAGKTTWTIIALVWALLYGHRRFPVCIAASSSMAKTVRKGIFTLLAEAPGILADFPPVPTALRKMNGAVQKGMALTYQGRNVGFESGEVALVLPDLRDENGVRLDAACGAIVACRGVGGSVRGLNIRGNRPDFVLFDDPQTQKDAHSASAIQRIDHYIHSDALNLAANTATVAAFMTITPQCADDLAQRIADRALHPNWSVSICPFLTHITPGFDEAADAFCEEFNVDAALGDFTRARSRAWYRGHRDLFAGVEAVDDHAFDKTFELDAVHHALNKIAAIGRPAFDAEYQMQPVRQTAAFQISDRLILSRIRRDTSPGVVPDNAVFVAIATDINPSYALSSVAVAFDVKLTAQVVAYRLTRLHIPMDIPEAEFDRRVYEALAAHGREVAEWGIKPTRWGVDAGGRQFSPVTAFAPNSLSLSGLAAIPMLGRAGRNWNPFVRSRIRDARDSTVLCRDSDGRIWLAWNADEYKERAQRAWSAEVGAPGGLSLFDGRVDHTQFAVQVANEILMEKRSIRQRDGRDGFEYKWQTKEPHDFGDCLAMCYALAAADGLSSTPQPTRTRRKVIIE